MEKYLGVRYPVVKDPRGYFNPQGGTRQIKGDLLSLILTEKNERVMENDFGIGLSRLLFEQSVGIEELAREMIIEAIEKYERRITVKSISITTNPDADDLDPADDLAQSGQILFIRIEFIDPNDINEVQELKLEVPLLGGTGELQIE